MLTPNGDKDAAKSYYTALAGGRDIEPEIIDAISEGVANMADILADEFGFNKDEYMDWTGVNVGGTNMGAMSPEYPEMPGHEKMALWTTHAGASDGYLYQGLKQNVTDRVDAIDVWYSSPAKSLIQDPVTKTVVGVTVERDGKEMNIRALNGVCICTGGFECNKEMVQHYLNVINYAPRGGQFNTGDGIKMAQAVGADLWHMDCYEGLFGLGSVTYPVEEGIPCDMIATLAQNAVNTGAAILVGTDGDRFVNESETVRHGHLYENGIWENPTFPEKVWYIIDETQKGEIEAAGAMPEEQLAKLTAYDSIGALAEGIGVDKDRLTKTIKNYNSFANNGEDYKCGREAQYMRAFDGKKYYAMYMVSGLLNTQGGPKRSANAEVLDTQGQPHPRDPVLPPVSAAASPCACIRAAPTLPSASPSAALPARTPQRSRTHCPPTLWRLWSLRPHSPVTSTIWSARKKPTRLLTTSTSARHRHGDRMRSWSV